MSYTTRLFLVSLSLYLFTSCGSKTQFIQPKTETISETVYASGYVKSAGQYQVFSKATGILEKIWVAKGDMVKKGQSLFSISNDVSVLNRDNAQLAASNADIRANQDKLQELRLTIDVSKKKMENDRLVVERQRRLWKDQIGTRFELEQRELAYTNSSSAYQSALLRYNELKKQLNFTSAQTKKSLSISTSMLSDYTVRSEVEGRIYAILKEKGEAVSPQMPLALIGDASTFTLIMQVDENDIVHIIPGQKVAVTMDSYKGKLFEAEVDKINPLMNERSRSFEVEAHFTKAPEVLYPNLTLEANIIIHRKQNAITIPRNFLLDNDSVWISNKEKRKVVVGLKDYQKVEILQGLSSQDKIYLPQ